MALQNTLTRSVCKFSVQNNLLGNHLAMIKIFLGGINISASRPHTFALYQSPEWNISVIIIIIIIIAWTKQLYT